MPLFKVRFVAPVEVTVRVNGLDVLLCCSLPKAIVEGERDTDAAATPVPVSATFNVGAFDVKTRLLAASAPPPAGFNLTVTEQEAFGASVTVQVFEVIE